MKYWVYKDSRILGPFDKDAFAGLPGVDSTTLVSAGDTAASGEGGWLPAGEVSDLAGVALDIPVPWPHDEPASTYGLLEKLQLESAGLVSDDDFPGASEDLFRDAEQKKNFGDLLSPRPSASEAELRRSKDRVSDLTFQLEMLYKRVAELESSQTDLMRRLAAKEVALRLQPPPAAAAPVVAEPVAPAVPAVPEAVLPPQEPPPPAPLDVEPLPIFSPEPPAPPDIVAVQAPEPSVLPAPPPAMEPPVEPVAPPPAEAVEPKKSSYPKPLHFKAAATIRSFRIASAPAAEAKPEPEPIQDVAPAVIAPPVTVPEPIAVPEPVAISSPVPPPPIVVAPPSQEEAPQLPVPVPLPAFTIAPAAEPIVPPPPPITAAEPAFLPAAADAAGASFSTFAPAPAAAPPATMSFAWGAQPEVPQAPPPSTQEVLARLSKPVEEPLTAPPRPARSNNPFLFAGMALVSLLGMIGYFVLRQPKDLKQMVSLDDSREHLGAQPTDDAARIPLVKPKLAEAPAPAPIPAESKPAASPELDAAVALVKGFPLDGGRGTVAQWLQYSYNASPDAGQETWSASSTGDKGYLVEYRFTPTARGGTAVHYLFAADTSMGLVFGKSLEAQHMLAGSAPRVVEERPTSKPKAKARPKAPRPVKKVSKRPASPEKPKEVPLMPLPSEGELKPPAEDDGAFGIDTVNTGL